MTSTDKSSSAYISLFQARNITASVANGTRGGSGSRGSLLLGQISSVLAAPPAIPPPTDLSASTPQDGGSGGRTLLTWTNNASNIVDTLIETEEVNFSGVPSGVYVPYSHSVLGSANSFITVFFGNFNIRVASITAAGTSARSNTIFVQNAS
jgi:hypothetical protein